MPKEKNNEGDHFTEVEPPTAKLPSDVFEAVTRRDLSKIEDRINGSKNRAVAIIEPQPENAGEAPAKEEEKPLSLDLSELEREFEQSLPTVRAQEQLSTRDKVISAIKACENPDALALPDTESATAERGQPTPAQPQSAHHTLPPPTMDSEGIKRAKKGTKAKK